MNRPLVWVALLFTAGVSTGAWRLLSAPAGVALLYTGCVLAALLYRQPRIRPVTVVLCFIGAGALWWDIRYTPPTGDGLSRYIAEKNPRTIALDGVVRSTQIRVGGNDRAHFVVDVHAVDGETLSGTARAIVYWGPRANAQVFPGQRVHVSGDARVALAEVNPGVHGYEDYLRSRGIHSAIDAAGPAAVEIRQNAPWYSPSHWAARLRQAQADRLARAMPADVLPFVYAVWLGDQSELDRREYQHYVASGTAHVLSVSGVHAAAIYLTLNFALRVLQVSRRARAFLCMAGVFAFALVAGASVPALRAAIMVSFYLAADALKREPDTPTALSGAGLVFLLWDPRLLFDIGFQLSFLSVASILVFYPLFMRWFERLPRWIRPTAATSVAVQILPVPVLAAHFHILPLLGAAVNIAVIPLLTLVLWLSFTTAVLAFIWSPLAQITGYAVWAPIYALRYIAESAASLRVLTPALTTPTPFAWTCFWIAALCLAALSVPGLPRRNRVAVAMVIAIIAGIVFWRPTVPPEVVFLDVGHGDAAFIRTAEDRRILIDGGNADDYVDYGQRVVAPFLWARGITRLDAVVVTHADRDHIGGLIYIVDWFDVDTVVLGPRASGRPLEDALLARCAERGTTVTRVQRGDTIKVGDVSLGVLHPPADWPAASSPNDFSVVLRASLFGTSFLFAGDIEHPAEAVLDAPAVDTDVLKVPHHGADTSSTPAFIGEVSPMHAVISTGARGRRVLDPEVPQRYAANETVVWRTDQFGAVRMTWLDGEMHIEAERVKRGYPVMMIR